jgi:glucokinase
VTSTGELGVGVDVGGTKILAITVDEQGKRVGEPIRRPTPKGGEAILDAIVASIDEARASVGSIGAVGVGIPGLVDRKGCLRVGPNLPGVIDVAFRADLESRVSLPVAVDNDATCATWAEVRIGAAKGATDAVMVTLGTGIGGGIVAHGELQRGANGFAGEPGHMVVDPNGPPCPCGRRGCWERFASGSGLGWLARHAAEANRASRVVELAGGDVEAVRGEHVATAALEGDEEALAVFRDFGWWAALGIANLVDILDPEIFVVGGGLVSVGDLIMEPIRSAFAGLVLAGDHRPAVPIVPATLGEDAGAIGAGLLALHRS